MINGTFDWAYEKNSVLRMVSDGLRTEVKLLTGSWMQEEQKFPDD
jgi:hypothetical protein